MIARNDRLKAVGYVEQAVGVIEGSIGSDEVSCLWFHGVVNPSPLLALVALPMDERFWLLSTAYNVGFECLESDFLFLSFAWSLCALCVYVGHRRLMKPRDGSNRARLFVGTCLGERNEQKRYVFDCFCIPGKWS